MSRLVVVSNRVADLRNPAQSGGLAVALGDALKESGGLWFGWDGNVAAADQSLAPSSMVHEGVTTVTVPLTQRDFDEYYLGFANRALWPVFHFRLDLAEFAGAFLEGYRRVNGRFADALIKVLRPNDEIWVHDYHLIPLGAELRARRIRRPIGFFLHIPFPPPDVLVATPEHDWLARSLFAYDVVGLQTEGDLSNFQRYVLDHCQGTIGADGLISAFGETIIARSFPIGIDVDSFAATARTHDAEQRITLLHQQTLHRTLIIGVDRLDYSKGLPERLKSFRSLLEHFPEHRKAVTLMQIAAPTREDVGAYADIRQELEGLSGAINGEFSDFDWTPVRYIHRSMPRDVLAALFRGCQVGMVTPLRDGMNLVAKEYIAAQRPEDPGVLVLSKFAGAAEELREAVIVNPYDFDEVAAGLRTAIGMPLEERRERHRTLFKRIRTRDVRHWRESFLSALRGARAVTVSAGGLNS